MQCENYQQYILVTTVRREEEEEEEEEEEKKLPTCFPMTQVMVVSSLAESLART